MLAPGKYGLLPISEVDLARLTAFDCGKVHLNAFLKEVALPFHTSRLGLTNVVFHADHIGPVGYFTLSNDAIFLRESERFELDLQGQDVHVNFLPAVKLCRLAVDTQLQRQGAGGAIMDLIRGEVYDSASNSAARLLVLDADNEAPVLKFYENQGFKNSLFAEGQAKTHAMNRRANSIKMWLDILA